MVATFHKDTCPGFCFLPASRQERLFVGPRGMDWETLLYSRRAFCKNRYPLCLKYCSLKMPPKSKMANGLMHTAQPIQEWFYEHQDDVFHLPWLPQSVDVNPPTMDIFATYGAKYHFSTFILERNKALSSWKIVQYSTTLGSGLVIIAPHERPEPFSRLSITLLLDINIPLGGPLFGHAPYVCKWVCVEQSVRQATASIPTSLLFVCLIKIQLIKCPFTRPLPAQFILVTIHWTSRSLKGSKKIEFILYIFSTFVSLFMWPTLSHARLDIAQVMALRFW